jgi:peptidoglycan/xylan/chitin deacetylase (PgdA/CDA1 family)
MNRRGFLKLAGAVAGSWTLARTGFAVPAAKLPPIFSHGSRALPAVALTYDDCYLLNVLQALERVLAARPEMKVTFFPVGKALLNLAAHDPDLWPRLVRAGHEIGYHTFDHLMPSTLSTRELVADFDYWLATAAQVFGAAPRVQFARPPYSDRSRSFLELCVERELVMAMWSADWSSAWGGDPERGRREMSRVLNGDVVLLHIRTLDLENTQTALALPAVQQRRLVTLSTLYAAARQMEDPRHYA